MDPAARCCIYSKTVSRPSLRLSVEEGRGVVIALADERGSPVGDDDSWPLLGFDVRECVALV
jgi:hypothetical protein